MKSARFTLLAILLCTSLTFAGQAPGAADAADIGVSSHDRVYAAEQFSNTVSVTDPSTNKLLGVIRLGDPQPGNFSPLYRGQVLVSASAPGTTGTPTTAPAVYSVSFNPATLVATVTPVFNDTDPAALANAGPGEGQVSPLNLTDPDSNEVVPRVAPRFAGDFMLDSQGDLQEIFVNADHAVGAARTLSVLNLPVSIDDSAWPTS